MIVHSIDELKTVSENKNLHLGRLRNTFDHACYGDDNLISQIKSSDISRVRINDDEIHCE